MGPCERHTATLHQGLNGVSTRQTVTTAECELLDKTGNSRVLLESPSACCRFINGLKAQGTETKDARVLFYGAGSSAVGVAQMIATLIEKEGKMSQEEAKKVGAA